MRKLFTVSVAAAGVVWFGQYLLGKIDEWTDDLFEWDTDTDEPEADWDVHQWRDWWGYEDDE